MNLWVKVAISEALSLVQIFVNMTALTPPQKDALTAWIASTQSLLALF